MQGVLNPCAVSGIRRVEEWVSAFEVAATLLWFHQGNRQEPFSPKKIPLCEVVTTVTMGLGSLENIPLVLVVEDDLFHSRCC
jgi:hypothetical protein